MALLSLADYKSYYGIISTGQDSDIATAIPRAEALVDTFCGYKLEESVITDELHDGGVTTIILKNMPVTTISSVSENTVTTTNYTAYMENGFLVKGTTSRDTLLPVSTFSPGLLNVAVSYTAGYTSATAPLDLKVGILKLIKHLFFDKKSSPAIKQVLHGEERSRSKDASPLTLGFLPLEIADILTPYRMM